MVIGSVDDSGRRELSKNIWFVLIHYSEERHKVKKWSGHVGSGWILGRFGGSGLPTGLPTGLCGSWVSGHWVVGVMSLQKTYGLYGLIHHIVEISGDVTDAGRSTTTREYSAT